VKSLSSLKSLIAKNLAFIILFVLGLLIPQITSDQYILHLLILSFILATLGASWDMLAGYGGLFSFGHQAFYAIGDMHPPSFASTMGHLPGLGS